MIERTETPEENAKKELLEETGMKAETIFLWKQAGMNGKVIWKNFYFIAKGCIKIQEPQLEPGEKITPIELDFEDYIKYTQREDFRNPEFQNIIFRMIHTPGELEKFKKLLFD